MAYMLEEKMVENWGNLLDFQLDNCLVEMLVKLRVSYLELMKVTEMVKRKECSKVVEVVGLTDCKMVY